MSPVNGLCVSVLDDTYHFLLTTGNADTPQLIQAHTPFPVSLLELEPGSQAVQDTVASLAPKFSAIEPSGQTFFCMPSTASTIHLRCLMQIVPKLGLPDLQLDPITYRQAYIASLPMTDCPLTLHFLESSPASSETEIFKIELNADSSDIVRQTLIHRTILHAPKDGTSSRVNKVMKKLVNPYNHQEPDRTRIIIVNAQPDVLDELRKALGEAKPGIRVEAVGAAELATGTSRYSPPRVQTRMLAQYVMPLPLSVVLADGQVVVVVPDDRKLGPAKESVLFTTREDNQTSVKIRMYLGDHRSASDNLFCGTVVVDGLAPMPKGRAIIRTSFEVSHESGALIFAEQVIDDRDAPGGPSVVAKFPGLIKYLGNDSERYKTLMFARSAPDVTEKTIPVGALPP